MTMEDDGDSRPWGPWRTQRLPLPRAAHDRASDPLDPLAVRSRALSALTDQSRPEERIEQRI